jgi:glycosyltransferase involved in cell wall biosynthesis
MRAWQTLFSLASEYDVHLLAGSRFFPGSDAELAASELPVVSRQLLPVHSWSDPAGMLHRLLRRMGLVRTPPDWLTVTPAVAGVIRRFVGGKPIELLHIMRLYMWPAAEVAGCVVPGVKRQLDLDDVESETRRRLAELSRTLGDVKEAERLLREALFLEQRERRFLPCCDRVWVCSGVDREKLVSRGLGDAVGVVPNTAPMPRACPESPVDGPFTFLFIGSMGYLPNRDGADFLCLEIVPLMRLMTRRPFRFLIVGHLSPGIRGREWTDVPEVEFLGGREDLAACYGDAHAVVVPLRAGGGTRIKVLEAFSMERPVVTTPVGVEGINAQDGVHVLMGADAGVLARQCVRLMEEPGLARSLALAARNLYLREYRPEVAGAAVLENTSICLSRAAAGPKRNSAP